MLSGAIKLQDHEFNVLPEAWEKLVVARDDLRHLTRRLKSAPDLSRWDEQQLENFLVSQDWSELDRKAVRNAPDKNAEFERLRDRRDLQRAGKSFVEFHKYVQRKKIFLPVEIKDSFESVSDNLWKSIFNKDVGLEGKDWRVQAESFEMLQNVIEPAVSKIEKEINRRLTSHGASRQSPEQTT